MKKLFFVFLLAIAFQFSEAQTDKPEFIHVGDVAPEFSITTLDGKVIDTQQLKGKVIYINFFATWCGPCMKELPFVEEKIWKTIKNPDFVMVVVGREHTNEEMADFLEKKGFTFPIAADTDRSIFSKFAHQNIPRNVIIDKNGKIAYSKFGFTEEEFGNMVSTIKQCLKE